MLTVSLSSQASFGSHSGSNSPSSNGTPIGAVASRLPCAGLNCCGIHPKNSHLSLYASSNGSSCNSAASAADSSNGILLDGAGVENHMNFINSMANGLSSSTTMRSGSPTTLTAFEQNLSQQLWHMCDDDKIKIMSQAEFEELLSPNRRHVITPYLLFYARYDLTAPGNKKEPESAGMKPGSGDSGGGPDCGMVID